MAYLESYFQAYTPRTLLSESTVRTHLKRLFEKLARTGKLTSSSSSLDPQFGFLICMIAHGQRIRHYDMQRENRL
jgi:hypothetical protein